MPKQKTNKAAAKRFKRTATGKYKYSKAGLRHIAGSKSTKRKRRLRASGVLSKADTKRIDALI